MKKTISITIAGVVFYIEEDGYDRLQGYLESIKRYFSSYEGSAEIIEDIEARIAEKFYEKVRKEEKQAITLEDVDQLIQTMGTVADFEAIEEDEDFGTQKAAAGASASGAFTSQSSGYTGGGPTSSTTAQQAVPPTRKRLYRDTKRKVLGGVCAGIAHYLNVDQLWVRLAALLLFLGMPVLGGISDMGEFFGPLSGFIFIVYIACWISFPGNPNLEEDEKLRKFYRDPERKALGGVAAGVSAYTGWDLGIIRFVWVLSILFFGTGLILYFVLWAITPPARTLTDRMKMQGEPITLTNIETNIKKTLNVENQDVEGTATKILLFPFRAIAAIFEAMGPFFTFLLVLIRIFAGVVMVLIGLSIILGLLVTLGVALGLSGLDNLGVTSHFPLAWFNDASPWMYIFGFMGAVVPAVAIGIAGLSLLGKQNYFKPVVWQTLLGVFLIGLIGSSILIPQYISNFARKGTVEKTVFIKGDRTPVFDMNYQDDEEFHRPDLTLEGYDGTDVKLVQTFTSRGPSTREAEKLAGQIQYKFKTEDSLTTFRNGIELQPGTPFRNPNLRMRLYIPYEKPFSMTQDFAEYVTNVFPRSLFDGEQFVGSLWKFTRDGKMVSLNRTIPENYEEYSNEDLEDDSFESSIGKGIPKKYELKDFSQLSISGGYKVEVKQGTEYRVTVYANNESGHDDIRVRVEGSKLVIDRKNRFWSEGGNRSASIRIEMPSLDEVEFSGAVSAIVKGFDQLSNVEISGASKATFMGLNAQNLEVDVHGAARLTLLGSVEKLNADLSGASKLEAFGLKAKDADIDASGASQGNVVVSGKLNASASGASGIRYKGEAQVQESHSGGGSVEKEHE